MERRHGEPTEGRLPGPDTVDPEKIKAEFVAANEKRDYSIYTWAMDAALEAKAAAIFPLLEAEEGDVIVDAGSGTGSLAELAAREFRGAHVYAVDLSHELQERAEEDQALTRLIFGNAADRNFRDNAVKAKYFSTSGHEMESFGGPGTMRRALQNTWRELLPGGRVIIRDFAKPALTAPVFMKIISPAGLSKLPGGSAEADIDYNTLSTRLLLERFQKEFGGGNRFQYEEVVVDGTEYIKIDPEWAHEFYLRKDYTGNWRQEIKEKYTYWTPAEAREALQDSGYVNIQIRPDPNEWIIAHRLRGKIELYRSDEEGKLEPIDFPPTHMVAMGEKPRQETAAPEKELPSAVDYRALFASIKIDRARSSVRVGDREFTVVEEAPLVGSKKKIFRLAGEPPRVLKIVRDDTRNDHNVFKSMYQVMARQEILRSMDVPHLAILESDPAAPPSRYLVQEAVPDGSRSAAELVAQAGLTQDDIRQMAKIVNAFEQGKQWQLDTNPHSWFRVTAEDGSTQMVYVSGKVYRYDEDWAFKKVGLLQWVDPAYVAQSTDFAAAIPTGRAYAKFAETWAAGGGQIDWWKKYLEPAVIK